MTFDFVRDLAAANARKGSIRPARWPDERLIEHRATLDIQALHKLGLTLSGRITVAVGGQQQTLMIAQEDWRGDGRLRPRWICPLCKVHRWKMYELHGVFACRVCQNLDFSSRHKNRFSKFYNRTRRLKAKLSANPHHRDAKRIRAEIRAGERALAKNLRRVLAALVKHLKDDGP